MALLIWQQLVSIIDLKPLAAFFMPGWTRGSPQTRLAGAEAISDSERAFGNSVALDTFGLAGAPSAGAKYKLTSLIYA